MKVLIPISLIAAAVIMPASAQKRESRGPKIAKPRIDDTVKASVYADNWFQLYINGELIATDSIKFIPHNVVSVDVLPRYPMTIAVMAKDNADAKTGLEYNNTQIGDGGFILKLGDGTVTNAKWKVKKFFWGPINGDTGNPHTKSIAIPENWHAVDFDDSAWGAAREFTQEEVGPKAPFFEHDFEGAKFIWSGDLKLDNTVIFRHRVVTPPDGKTKSWDLSKPPYANPSTLTTASTQPAGKDPKQAVPFRAFADSVKLRWDEENLYVESDGIPDHPMMVGITAWQQQIPLPHPYTGDNAWRIPLRAEPAAEPMSAKSNFFRGAIALAANGVPIFNPIKNDGRTDTFLAGELDQWGGHCGRADDYHYHIAPVHLQDTLGKDKPIAYALDGYPIYGYEEPDGSAVAGLDEFNGHKDAEGNYHYHATKTYPYLNGGFHGKVTERNGQVDPQPRAQGVRPAQRPLRGAKITKFHSHGDHHHLHYEVHGHSHEINYEVHDDRSVTIEKVDTKGNATRETFRGKGEGGGKGRKLQRGEKQRPPRQDSKSPSSPRKRAAAGDPGRPNIVMVLVDDMGWKDMGFSGNTFVDTPHCDRLATEGVVFNHSYASAPNCAPTRACLLSGQYTPRHGVYTVVDERHSPGQAHHKIMAAESKSSMATEVVTIAEALKPAGYSTAIFGMWNLGRGRSGPTTATGQGFDRYVSTKTLGFEKDAYRDGERYLTDAFTDEMIDFIAEEGDKPFFIYFAPHATHHPYEPKPELLEKYRDKAKNGSMSPEYAATIEALDANIGRLMNELENRGIAENTLFIFTADNGGTPENVAPFNGSKGSLYDGGLRVPTFIWGRGVSSQGLHSDTPIASIDFFPTIIEIAGVPVPDGHHLDGKSLLSEMEGQTLSDRDLFWHFPAYIGRGSPSSAIRRGQYKLIQWFQDDRVELFDLASDPGERNNLAQGRPELARSLSAALNGWQQKTGAALPGSANPNYDPNAPRKGGGRDQRGKGKSKKRKPGS